jgi:hypothetical protein
MTHSPERHRPLSYRPFAGSVAGWFPPPPTENPTATRLRAVLKLALEIGDTQLARTCRAALAGDEQAERRALVRGLALFPQAGERQ